MRVICTTTEIYIAGKNVGKTSIIRGSIYHVVDIKLAEQLIKILDWNGGRPAPGDWYELLELEGHHHCSNFLELPDDLFESEQSKITEYGRIQ